jgi:hypothetical protein
MNKWHVYHNGRHAKKGEFMEEKKASTAPCGLDCFNCELYVENLTDELAVLIHEKLGITEKEVP